MADPVPPLTDAEVKLSPARFVLTVAWIAVQFVLAYYLGHSDIFFYQGF